LGAHDKAVRTVLCCMRITSLMALDRMLPTSYQARQLPRSRILPAGCL
jgi:hypothetical protein